MLVRSGSLGRLEGIDFLSVPSSGALDVGREVAGAFTPFHSRVGGYGAEGPFGECLCPGTTLARFDDRMATAAVEGAPFPGHESALDTFLHCYALHGKLLLFR